MSDTDIIVSDDELDSMFKRFDTDNSGTIDKKEYLSATINQAAFSGDKALGKTFDILANNADRKIKKKILLEAINNGWMIEYKIPNLIDESCKGDEVAFDDFKMVLKKIAYDDKVAKKLYK